MDIPDISTWQIVKWVLIVLVAAFIGQFGKTFAQYLMNRFRRKKAGGPMADPTAEITGKAKKKEDKARLKAQKKDNKNK